MVFHIVPGVLYIFEVYMLILTLDKAIKKFRRIHNKKSQGRNKNLRTNNTKNIHF